MKIPITLWLLIWVIAILIGVSIGNLKSMFIDKTSTEKFLKIIKYYEETIETYKSAIATYDKTITEYQAIIKRLENIIKWR